MKVFSNTFVGFVEEILTTLFLSLILILAFYKVGALNGISISNLIVVYILILFIFTSIFRIIRWAIVYHAPVYLFFLSFPALVSIFIGSAIIKSKRDLYSVLSSLVLIFVPILYFLVIYKNRKKIIENSPPGWRIKKLISRMSWIERLTLIFPDNYIKYLKTGDERYLEN